MVSLAKNRNGEKFFFYFMLLLMAASIAVPGMRLISSKGPQAVNGTLDLTNWDRDKDGPVKLHGAWEFYFGKLLTPADFKNQQPDGKTIQHVPARWTSYQIGANKVPTHGTATYRLKILLPDAKGSYGIKITSIYASARIFVDGQQVLTCGNPGNAPENTVHKYCADTGYFSITKNEAEILVQVANYISSYSGIYYEIYFGNEKSITALRLYNFFIDAALISGMIFIALYFLGLSFQRKNRLEVLFFAVYCLFSAIHDSTCSEVLLNYVLASLSYNASVKIQVLSLILSFYALFNCVYHAFNATYARKAKIITAALSLFFILLTCFTNFYLWHYTYILFCAGNIYIISAVVYIIYKQAYVKVEGKYYLYTAIISSSILFLMGLCNIVWALESNIFLPVFQPIFVLSLALFMSEKYENYYKTVEQLSERLSALDKQKDDFLAKTSHELKTPLNGIINISQSLLEGSGGRLNGAQAEDVQLIASIGKRLSILLYDLLDYSKLKVMDLTLNLSSIDVHQVVESAADIFRYLITGKPVHIENNIRPDTCIVLADENRLKQIISNLLDNAIKFTPQGTITISSYLEGEFAFIEVRDSGIGIPENKLKDIFSSYEQLASISPETTGAGLGLSVTKQLVELHRGKIFAASQPGKGSSFTFSLPRAKKGKNREIAPSNKMGGQEILYASVRDSNLPYTVNVGGDSSVLIVDDEYSNLKALLNILTVCKYNVTAVGSGAAALHLLEGALKYDLCILDVMMPGMCGYEVCRKIRERYSPLDFPILLLTAKALPEDLEAGFKAGANDFLEKPFEVGELKCRVHTLVQLKKSKDLLFEKETAFLQAQIRPHFLFNALNTLRSFCYTNPTKAGELLGELGVFLRSHVDFTSTSSFIPIEKELRLVQAYVAIEKARFGKQLEVEYHIDPAALKYSILPLTIQPIVENSIRHGLMKRNLGGKVILSLLFQEERINIQVIDNGIGIPAPILESLRNAKPESGSVGLTNINRRLLNLYGTALDISSEKSQGTTVSFSIPAKNYTTLLSAAGMDIS
ncbi:ATP-binding protein [Candidatus Formimonas warabiya]|uniref:Stage 0 sporulation protein A homolog n=1 Tax=Formimonas warabiya TaxID=1761012 RepID=A0A3G1KMM3_FORW1|nr:ATP-binding protein [Candidatus Formimonas warabiya]ATW23710.1 regulator [Candidatus Formimonas warabiya]